MLIEIDGIDGAGKTTQCELLGKALEQLGRKYVMVREPGGTEVGDNIKSFIMDQEQKMEGGTQTFLFLASKHELYQSVIFPALEREDTVIADRGSLSFISYHAIVSKFSKDLLFRLLDDITHHNDQVVRILLDVSPEVGQIRLSNKPQKSKFDLKNISFFEQQRTMFRFFANTYSDQTYIIDAHQTVDQVHEEIIKILNPFFDFKAALATEVCS